MPVARAQNSTGTGGSGGTPTPAPPAPTLTPTAVAPAPAPPAAPPPPPVATPTPAPAASPPLLTPTTAPVDSTRKGNAADLSLSPSVPQFGGGTNISTKQAETLAPSTSGASDEWKFEFHGYMRAPMRASLGPPSPVNHPARDPSAVPADAQFNYVSPFPAGAAPPSGTQLHGIVRVPGSNYAAWDFTNNLHGPWSQLNFSYGNSRVTSTVVVDAYNQTDGSYRNLQAQQGIDQVFLTLRFPEAFGDYGGLVWNIGSFPNRYGTAGKYDGGMYETYQFGRTHVSGETLTATFSNLDQMGDWVLTLEHGVGAKIDLVPFTNNQNYQIFGSPGGPTNTNGASDLSSGSPDYLPWSGPVPQGSTYVHHAHILAKYQKSWNFGLHYIFTWTPDDNWDPRNSRLPSSGDAVPRHEGPIQGSIAVVGGEVRFTDGELGDGYVSFTHVDARNVNALADSLELLHANGGPSLKQTYFGNTYNRHTGIYTGPQNETGTIDNISLQYSFSFGAYARAPEDWWGNGPDLVITGFGMFTAVDSKAPPIALGNVANTSPNTSTDPTRATSWNMTTKKVKFGFDAFYTPLSWLGYGVRFDMVKPDLDGAYSRVTTRVTTMVGNVELVNPGGSATNFSVLTGRLVLKTEFVTHETVTLEYARYFLGAAAYPADARYAWVPQADANAFELSATMWW